MHDLFNAGRHWLIGTAEGEHVNRSIGIFLHFSGKKPEQIATQVLRAARVDSIDNYPEVVQQRLKRLGLSTALVAAGQKSVKKSVGLGFRGKVITLVGILVCLVGLCVFVAGLLTVFEWVRG